MNWLSYWRRLFWITLSSVSTGEGMPEVGVEEDVVTWSDSNTCLTFTFCCNHVSLHPPNLTISCSPDTCSVFLLLSVSLFNLSLTLFKSYWSFIAHLKSSLFQKATLPLPALAHTTLRERELTFIKGWVCPKYIKLLKSWWTKLGNILQEN